MKLSIDILQITFHKPYDLTIEGNRDLERIRRMSLTSITAIIQKVLATAIPLITIRITYDYLGTDVYGLWSTITNFFALFSFADLGLGNGLQTKLSHASGMDDNALCKTLISSAYALLSLVAAILLIVFLSFFHFLNWPSIMNAVEPETVELAAPIVFVIVLPRIFLIPVSIISRTQYAFQEGYISNVWEICGTLLSLLFVVVASYFDLGKVILLCGTALIPFVIMVCNLLLYNYHFKPSLRPAKNKIDIAQSKELLSLGISFCILSVLTTVGLSMDTFIVAKTSNLNDAASFSIIYKLSIIISAALGVFAQPLWGANGEALARGDIKWVSNNTKRMSLIMVLLTSVLAVIVCCLSPVLLKLWMGDSFNYSMSCLIWMLVMQILQAFISPYFMVLNASGVVIKQILLFLAYTPLSFLLKFLLSTKFGISVIPAVGAILYFLIIVIGTYIFSNRCLNSSNTHVV